MIPREPHRCVICGVELRRVWRCLTCGAPVCEGQHLMAHIEAVHKPRADPPKRAA